MNLANNLRKSAGFSLVEILVVLVIMGLLMSVVAPRVLDQADEARVKKVYADFKSIETALKIYKLDNYVYPTTEQGLIALVEPSSLDPEPRNFKKGGYLEQVPESVNHWQSDIPAGPENLLGKWLPATEASPAQLRGVPLVVEIPNEDPLTIYLAALPISNGAGGPARLESNAKFEVGGELDGETDVFLGIHAVDEDGNFAGKFLAYTKANPNAEGQFEVTLPASQFALDVTLKAYEDQLPESPVNFIVKDCWCFTLTQSGLALEEVELKPAQ